MHPSIHLPQSLHLAEALRVPRSDHLWHSIASVADALERLAGAVLLTIVLTILLPVLFAASILTALALAIEVVSLL